jgi:3-oxoacyl-[acyl-carrier-protein] synthase II
MAHATINLDDPDPACDCGAPRIVANRPRDMGQVHCILNNSFGMLGINSVLIVRKFAD